jgi:formylglycine-generating enzyme required for sulfatase activity
VEFCKKLSELPEERAAGRVYRLPTEAEWEHACRAGSTTAYWFGEDGLQLAAYGWYANNSGNQILEIERIAIADVSFFSQEVIENQCQTHGVVEKIPNPWGLYDMHGNVWEWCSDWYGGYPTSAVFDPAGPATGSHRVYRGGGWLNRAAGCRSAFRSGGTPDDRSNGIGFRVALSSPTSP